MEVAGGGGLGRECVMDAEFQFCETQKLWRRMAALAEGQSKCPYCCGAARFHMLQV